MTREALEAECKAASVALQQFPRGTMGLTPDAVKSSPEYRAAKLRYAAAFNQLRAFNHKNTQAGRARPRRG